MSKNTLKHGFSINPGLFYSYVIIAIAVAVALALSSCQSRPSSLAMPESQQPKYASGAVLYQQHCAVCHGKSGRGDGRAATTFPIRPRDFRKERFAYISTTSGGAPADEDLVRTIRRGIVHAAMPGATYLSDSESYELASYVREINRLGLIEMLREGSVLETEDEAYGQDEGYGEEEREGTSLSENELQQIARARVTPGPITPVPARPGSYRSSLDQGRKLYALNCAACHGPLGKGNAQADQKDDLGRAIRPRDLTNGKLFGGSTDKDLYWRIRCGLPGTPMPGYSQLTNKEVWQLVDYIRVLAQGRH